MNVLTVWLLIDVLGSNPGGGEMPSHWNWIHLTVWAKVHSQYQLKNHTVRTNMKFLCFSLLYLLLTSFHVSPSPPLFLLHTCSHSFLYFLLFVFILHHLWLKHGRCEHCWESWDTCACINVLFVPISNKCPSKMLFVSQQLLHLKVS